MCIGSAALETCQELVNLCWPGQVSTEGCRGQQEGILGGEEHSWADPEMVGQGWGETSLGDLGGTLTPALIVLTWGAQICVCTFAGADMSNPIGLAGMLHIILV